MVPFLDLLDGAALTAAGLPPGWTLGYRDRVRFAEIDGQNHVNHTAYLRWFEDLRVRYLQACGIFARDGSGPMVVLRHLEAGYLAPMVLNESYIVATRTVSFRTTSFRMEYGVYAPDLRVEGTAVVVLLDAAGRKTPLPATALELFATRDRAEDQRHP